MAKYRTSLSLALIAAYFIALPVISEYARLAHVGQFTYRIADYSPVLLLFCIVSLTGAVLFTGTVRQDGGRRWVAVPLTVLLLLLAVFGPSYPVSAVSLLTIISLAPVVLLLLLAFPLRQVAYDAEIGSLDIDKLVTGVTKSQRDIIRSVKETIRNVSGDSGGQAKVDEVIEILVQQGFSRDKVEHTLEQLKRGGEVIEPRHGLVKLIG